MKQKTNGSMKNVAKEAKNTKEAYYMHKKKNQSSYIMMTHKFGFG